MTQERVKSKNLFNFRPQGFIDPVVLEDEEKMKKDMGMDPAAMEEQMLSQTETEFAGGMRYYTLYTIYYILFSIYYFLHTILRAMMDGMLGQTPFATDPAYVEVRLGSKEDL